MSAELQSVPALSSFAEHARAYNDGVFGKKYPDSRFLIGERGCYATWMPGRNFQNRSRLYGAQPPDFGARMWSLFPDARRALQLFSGSLTKEQVDGDWELGVGAGLLAKSPGGPIERAFQVRFDNGLHPLAAAPDVRGDAQQLQSVLLEAGHNKGKTRHDLVQAGTFQGLFALVDSDDFARIAQHRWFATKRPYAVSRLGRGASARQVPMHELIAGTRAPDHENGNTLDNRRRNLRRATHAQNCRNRKIPSTNKTGYKGVSKKTNCARWSAQIAWRIHGKHRVRYLGLFKSPEAAARAYNAAAQKHFGRFARLNKIPRTS